MKPFVEISTKGFISTKAKSPSLKSLRKQSSRRINRKKTWIRDKILYFGDSAFRWDPNLSFTAGLAVSATLPFNVFTLAKSCYIKYFFRIQIGLVTTKYKELRNCHLSKNLYKTCAGHRNKDFNPQSVVFWSRKQRRRPSHMDFISVWRNWVKLT